MRTPSGPPNDWKSINRRWAVAARDIDTLMRIGAALALPALVWWWWPMAGLLLALPCLYVLWRQLALLAGEPRRK